MEERIRQRLAELEREQAAGERRLVELDADASRVREVLLRISGAGQVLRELLADPEPEAANGDGREGPSERASAGPHAPTPGRGA